MVSFVLCVFFITIQFFLIYKKEKKRNKKNHLTINILVHLVQINLSSLVLVKRGGVKWANKQDMLRK